MSGTAIVLYNLGGPDSQAAVRPFLFNLFNDPAILRMPAPIRWVLAEVIARRRAPVAREIYAKMGGRSPILPETEAQAEALQQRLQGDVQIFVAMRYWPPMADEIALAVADYMPERVVLVPLYPQFSTTTTGSFLAVWHRAARAAGVTAPETALCCYPDEVGFVDAIVALTTDAIGAAEESGEIRVLFSAHGLPKKIVDAGDPYRMQVERTVAAVLEKLGRRDLDYVICYQSRVGPVEWIKPYTDEEVVRAAHDGKVLVVVPVAFVSEHSETLVELDIDYRDLAMKEGAKDYRRVPTVGTHPAFIDGLARLIEGAKGTGVQCGAGGRICGPEYRDCLCGIGAGDGG